MPRKVGTRKNQNGQLRAKFYFETYFVRINYSTACLWQIPKLNCKNEKYSYLNNFIVAKLASAHAKA